MKHHFGERLDRWTVGGLLVGLLVVAALGVAAAKGLPTSTSTPAKPAKVEAIEGSKVKKVTLTAEGVGRLGLTTVPMAEAAGVKTIPYSALIYLPDGTTWTYVETAPLSYQREPITVTKIEGDQVRLSQGPAAGAKVVSVGAAELYGAETGIGK
ncbi:efflux RND transporter periplasmic adaptor subunit [Catellatospora paridis]|uniref:hypothetical protein n=1 Tax=Catellatospora paridis TaxID=1617086 RepID=UPI001E63A0EB|nr:hypothetical protein [Catellatospora paridis]